VAAAIRRGHEELGLYLLAQGAEPHQTTAEGEVCSFFARAELSDPPSPVVDSSAPLLPRGAVKAVSAACQRIRAAAVHA
jgi:hypothetical protein